ncbi:hypothetical protein Enr13x_11370 [Stieleria neptunia]|uniref:Polysaccharide biosynthesis protein n=2 Tax=Stieleria neptunia TaxID=2527979 RepID=A0A518HKJ4_9BACT|nr:hypothetical protein Enr13x_11370 [Stieleria neptunia]
MQADVPLIATPQSAYRAFILALPRVREWGKLIAITGSAQVAVQAIGFITGILVIRLLPTQEYALYTIANTMLGTMALLADGGVSSGVMSQGGKVWSDKKKLGAVLVTGFALRRKFAVGSAFVAIPVLLYLLRHHGASWGVSAMLAFSLMPVFVATLSGKLLEIAPKLNQDISKLQKLQVGTNLIRLASSGFLLMVFPLAAVAIAATGVAQIWWNRRLAARTEEYADFQVAEDRNVRDEMLVIVRRVLPSSIYFSFSLQLSFWLLSFFGSGESIAQLGALSRVAVAVGVLTTISSYLVIPRFARLPASPSVLKAFYIKVQLVLFVVCGFGCLVGCFLAGPILAILPVEYASLTLAFQLKLGVAAFGVLIGTLVGLNASRGYIMSPKIQIPLNLAIVAVTAAVFQPTTLIGVLYVDLTRAAIAPVVQNAIFFTHLKQAK